MYVLLTNIIVLIVVNEHFSAARGKTRTSLIAGSKFLAVSSLRVKLYDIYYMYTSYICHIVVVF